MIQSKLFRYLMVVSIIGVIAFMFIGFLSGFVINQLLDDDSQVPEEPKDKIELIKVSLLNVPFTKRESYIKDLNKRENAKFVLVRKDMDINCEEDKCKLYPVDKFHSLVVYPAKLSLFSPPHHPPRGHHRRPPPGGARHFKDGNPPPPPPSGRGAPLKKLLMTTGIQFVAMIFYIIILIILIFYYAKKRRKVGEGVFEKIMAGELEARFPVSKVDDFGTNTKLFNEMADEIMKLVLKLRKKDNDRKHLFKTLAHDLKTPATSLKSIMETLSLRNDELSPEQKNELYKMSTMEIDYFSALLDDILFLAKVQDPEFKTIAGKTELVSTLKELCETVSFLNKSLEVSFSTNVDEVDLSMDHSSVMRLFRNALDNACLYGKSKINVDIHKAEKLEITISNDGSGFDNTEIKKFGTMMTHRTRTNNQGSLSFGLGSVIMSAIVESADGSITPENILSDSGDVIGARIRIEI